ncbi:HAD-IA family hydrolase [Amylibacter sp.]|nr:HAD-IA family hydrolase [Amylibacter sp.]
MKSLAQFEAIILDCDGVIFNSNDLKIEAFRKAIDEFPSSAVSSFIVYFRNNFGTSRYHLARVFIEDFLKIDFDNNLYQDILQAYSKQCVYLYAHADLTDGLMDFLEQNITRKLFVASGSDQNELREVMRVRNLDNYFVDIFGSPKKKSDIVASITVDYPQAIMIGDAMSDFQAAQSNDIEFLFMAEYSTNPSMILDTTLNRIHNLWDLV